jgi:hypothetical protein
LSHWWFPFCETLALGTGLANKIFMAQKPIKKKKNLIKELGKNWWFHHEN